MGIEHPSLGQTIVLVALPAAGRQPDTDAPLAACRELFAGLMMPTQVEWLDRDLPRNANGKIDRKLLATQRAGLYAHLQADKTDKTNSSDSTARTSIGS